jgi:3-isopropylmalate/(R)-2-methylmalate dehydratase small subunit
MEPFKSFTAVAVPIDGDNVDTDQIIPARLMRKSRREGLHGTYLFRDLRFNEDGSEKPEFILNHSEFRKARIIVGAKNYACGSMRIGAMYAHYDFGIRLVIVETMSDTFYRNCIKMGILPVRLQDNVVAELRGQLHRRPGATMSVDLERQIITGPDGTEHRFDIDAFEKRSLLLGLSPIALTLEREPEIAAFEQRYYHKMPWLQQQ